MASMSLMLFTSAILLVAPVLAKTDLAGCTYSDSVVTPAGGFPYATRIWFVEDTGEICEFLDCGGGRAPPKTTVPGCGSYEGTDTYSPRFLAPSTTSVAAASTAEVISEAPTTKAPSLEPTPSSSAEADSLSTYDIASLKRPWRRPSHQRHLRCSRGPRHLQPLLRLQRRLQRRKLPAKAKERRQAVRRPLRRRPTRPMPEARESWGSLLELPWAQYCCEGMMSAKNKHLGPESRLTWQRSACPLSVCQG